MLIDTHAHLDFPKYDNDRGQVIKRANNTGVGAIINAATDLPGSIRSIDLSREHACVYAACGIHPHNAGDITDEAIERLRNLALSSKKVVAIGEVGLDFYRERSSRDTQISGFCRLIKLSEDLGLPLILHCREAAPGRREAADLLIQMLRASLKPPVKGVMHCFSGNEDILKESLDLGLYISFTCNVTFNNAHRLREVLKSVPLERLLLETDAPFLAPQAKRGERNEPAYLSYLVEAMADNIGVDRQEIERLTTENAKRLFGIA